MGGRPDTVILKLFLCIQILNSFVFISCDNSFLRNLDEKLSNIVETDITSEKDVKTIDFTGYINISDEYLQVMESSRTAFPSIPASVTYTVVVTAEGKDPLYGILASDKISFTIDNLEIGYIWTFTVTMYDGTNPIMGDSYTMESAFSEENSVVNHTFNLKPAIDSGSGQVSLSMKVPASVSSIKLSCGNSNWPFNQAVLTDSGSYKTAQISTDTSHPSIPSGAYDVKIDFKDSNGYFLYTDYQTINIFKNLTTNKWVYNGGKTTVKTDGTYELTSELIENAANTVFYVGTTSFGTPSDTTGTGSPFKPLATIKKACEIISATGNNSKDYTIYVTGILTGAQEIGSILGISTDDKKANSITVCGCTGLNSNRKPLDELNGNYAETVLKIETTVPVILKNIKITGGKRGIMTESTVQNNVTLSDGVLITGNGYKEEIDNFTTAAGGGVYHGAGKLFMNGFSCVGDSDASSCPNTLAASSNAAQTAGGVYVRIGAYFYMGYKDENTPLECTGGIYHNYASSTPTTDDKDGGGGIAVSSGTVKIASGTIKYNGAAGNGGAIATTYGTIEISGGTICNNQAGQKGGAVFLGVKASDSYKGTLKIKGSAYIPSGSDGKNDVYIDSEVDTNNNNVSGRLFVSGKITPPAVECTDGIVATITPKSYSLNRKLVQLAGGVTDTTLEKETWHFAVSPNPSDTSKKYFINSGGKLAQAQTAETISSYLSGLTANTTSTPYDVTIKVSSQEEFTAVKAALTANSNKYVNITLLCPGITELPEYAFNGCTSIVGITYPEGITSIGRFALSGCSNLSSLVLSNTITATSYRDLNGCSSLTSLTLPESLTAIYDQSLAHTGITSITIPKNVKSLADDAFVQSNSLTDITVVLENPYWKDIDGVLYSKDGTKLSCCPAAKTGALIIQNGVKVIRGWSVYTAKITSVTIPASVTTIEQSAFEYCSQMATITFEGTTAQWNNISKGSDWVRKSSVPATVVHCSDGVVDL